MVGYNVTPGSAIYCATKAAVRYFSEAIGIELKGKIDIQGLTPAATISNLLHGNKAIESFSLSSKNCVKGSLRDLGHENITGGHWWHDI
jgi:short-subunit dehydrogenase